MKKLFLLSAVIAICCQLFAQTPSAVRRPAAITPKPLPIRQVSGIVKDSSDVLIGATVTLMSPLDTLKTATNGDGIFVFKNVRSATFYLTVASLGYKPTTRHLLNNDAIPRLTLDPIILQTDSKQLADVIVNGTPSVVYKGDTVEYRARDYKVREGATVDELIKKMEGMEVANDGTVTHQGIAVTRAKLNGKIISGGDVAAAIQNLPADIVEKVQVVDDYGDEAARTGIKDGEPQKILNITTLANKSIGNTGNITAGVGNNNRYESRLAGTRLNANQQIGLNGNWNRTVTGIANSGGGQGGGGFTGGAQGGGAQARGGQGGTGGGNPGRSSALRPGISYNDDWGKKIEVNGSYSLSTNNSNSTNSSFSQQLSTKGTIYSSNDGSNERDGDSHNFNFQFSYTIDTANFLRITPSLSYSSSNTRSITSRIRTGLVNQDNIGTSTNHTSAPNLGGVVFFQHRFDKTGTSASVQLSLNDDKNDGDQGQDTHILYRDTVGILLKDSLINRVTTTANLTHNYRASVTFSKVLNTKSRIEFNGQMNRREYDNSRIANDIDVFNVARPVARLTNIFYYSFTENRLALNYRWGNNLTKVSYSMGLTGVPAVLQGTKESLHVSTRRTSFNLIPIARFQYAWSRVKRLSINYSGAATEPSFDQIQPVRDETNPQNPVVGNPALKAVFRHTISGSFNNNVVNRKLVYSLNVNTNFTQNQVSRNVVQIPDTVYEGTRKIISLINETRYLNMNGTYGMNSNYSIQKNFVNRKYALILRGSAGYTHSVAMSNDFMYTATSWNFRESFGPQLNPYDWFEMNPTISFDFSKSDFSLERLNSRLQRNLAFNINGQIDFTKTFSFGYNASKNYVSGINANVTSNPFIINANIDKRFFKRRNGTLSIRIFDLLNQNNFINRNITDNSITDIKTNPNSRYFMMTMRLGLQKWSGTPQRNGRPMQRRGDGSFIN